MGKTQEHGRIKVLNFVSTNHRPKSGCTMTYYKGKGVMFGGVTDTNVEEDRIQSVCLNEM